MSDANPVPGFERSPGRGNGNPLQKSCLENPMDIGAWQAAVRGVAASDMTGHTHTHTPLLKNKIIDDLEMLTEV